MAVAGFATLSLLATPVAGEEDGRALFFTTQSGSTFVHDYARSQTHQVASGNFTISVSPDGRLLSVVGGNDVRYVRPGGAATVLVDDQRFSYEASWAGTSKEFAFTRGDGGFDTQLFVGDVVENRVVRVPTSDSVTGGIDFAPHRRAVAASVASGDLVVFDLDTGSEAPLVDMECCTNEGTYQPKWSPSGDVIAYLFGWNRPNELRLIDPETGVTTVLSNVDSLEGSLGGLLAWSPDGTKLAYVRSGWNSTTQSDVSELVTVGRDGRETVALADGASELVDFVWTGASTLAFTDGATIREVTLGGQVSEPLVSATNIYSLSYTSRIDTSWLPLVATARSVDDSCPEGTVPEAGFSDVGPTNPHGYAIDCVVWWEVALGTGDATYSPGTGVSRSQMATFIARTILTAGGQLPDSPPDAFSDDDGSPHETAINQLAAAGIVSGTGPNTYGPAITVSRAQMATFLARAYRHRSGAELPPARGDYFADDNGTPHEAAINLAAESGLASGPSEGRFDPSGSVRRDQMASFLARLLDLVVEETSAVPPSN